MLWEKVPGHLFLEENAETRRHKSKLRGLTFFLPPSSLYPLPISRLYSQ